MSPLLDSPHQPRSFRSPCPTMRRRGAPRPMARAVLALLAALIGPATAQDPCRLVPFDATTENGFGSGSGLAHEFCSKVPTPPALCMDGTTYWTNAVVVLATRTTLGATTMPVSIRVRDGSAPGAPPGGLLSGPVEYSILGVPQFPATVEFPGWLENMFVRRGLTQGMAPCVRLTGNATPNQFVAVDRSVATPPVECWGGTASPPAENCLTLDAQLRALKVGALVSPIVGIGSGAEVIPPITGLQTVACRFGPVTAGSATHFIDCRHTVPGATSALLGIGEAGELGTRRTWFTSPPPNLFTSLELNLLEEDALERGALYVEIVGADPQQSARGQLEPAGLVFANGFEVGAAIYWWH